MREKIIVMGGSFNPPTIAHAKLMRCALDGIWGVCLAMDNPLIANPNNWNGENLLGFALMETRDILRNTY